MDIAHLKTFVAVVEEKSFTAAAARLNVAKSVCSRRVSELEVDLNAHLVNRTTRSVVPTSSGLEYYQRALEIIHQLDEANAAAKGEAKFISGRLKLAVPTDYCRAVLGPEIESFLTKHIEVNVELDLSNHKVDLISGGYDAAVRIGKLDDSGLFSRKISTMKLICCASPDYIAENGAPKELADLAEHDCIVYSNSSTGRDWVFHREGKEIRKRVSGRLFANDGMYQRSLALKGTGVAYLPDFIIGDDLKSGALVPVLTGYECDEKDVAVVFSEKRNMRAVLRAFIDHLSE